MGLDIENNKTNLLALCSRSKVRGYGEQKKFHAFYGNGLTQCFSGEILEIFQVKGKVFLMPVIWLHAVHHKKLQE